MRDNEDNATASQPTESRRITLGGRMFGRLSFSADDIRSWEAEMEPRASIATDQLSERLSTNGARVTGSRRRTN